MKVPELLSELRGLTRRRPAGSAASDLDDRCSACGCSGRWARPSRATRSVRCAASCARVKTVLREKGVKD